jgi:hypothetical protein
MKLVVSSPIRASRIAPFGLIPTVFGVSYECCSEVLAFLAPNTAYFLSAVVLGEASLVAARPAPATAYRTLAWRSARLLLVIRATGWFFPREPYPPTPNGNPPQRDPLSGR